MLCLDLERCHLEARNHWRMHVRMSYVCPRWVVDVSSTSRFAYVTIQIMREVSATFASDLNDLAYAIGPLPQDGSAQSPW